MAHGVSDVLGLPPAPQRTSAEDLLLQRIREAETNAQARRAMEDYAVALHPPQIRVDAIPQEAFDKLMHDLEVSGQAVSRIQAAPASMPAFQQVPIAPSISKFTNAEIVMEALRRGFAVVKCPEPGQLPETMRG